MTNAGFPRGTGIFLFNTTFRPLQGQWVLKVKVADLEGNFLPVFSAIDCSECVELYLYSPSHLYDTVLLGTDDFVWRKTLVKSQFCEPV